MRWPLIAALLAAALTFPSYAGAVTASSAKARHGVTAQIKRGTLVITGNRKENSVTLRLERRRRGVLEVDVKSNGSADFAFRRRAFRRVVVRAGSGDDALGISDRNGSFFRSERIALDGGSGGDRLVFTGSSATDSLALATSRRRLRIARGAGRASAAASRTVSARGLEEVSIRPLGGADTIAIGDLARSAVNQVALQLGLGSGGDGAADTVLTSATGAANSLTARRDATRLSLAGLPWTVTVANLEGGDRMAVNGGGGADTLHLFGTVAADTMDVSAAGALLHAELGGAAVEADEFEALRLEPLAGQDTLRVHDLAGTDVGLVAADLGVSLGGVPDGQADSLSFDATTGADSVAVSGGPSGILLSGLAAGHAVVAADPIDRLAVNGLGGADTIGASGLAANAATLSLHGGPDDDALTGSGGADTFAWEPGDGSDVIDGGAGTDTAAVDGSDAADAFAVAPAGAQVSITQAADGQILDMDGVERADLAPRGGADNVTLNDLTATDVRELNVDLGAASGGGDAAADNVTVNATNAGDTVSLSGGPALLDVTGLLADVVVTVGEAANDRLTLNARGGNDTIDASSVAVGAPALTLSGDLGNDSIRGSNHVDTLNGGDGDDTIFATTGDTVNPGAGNDSVFFSP